MKADGEDEVAGTGVLAGGRRRREPQTTTRPVSALNAPAQPLIRRLRLGPDLTPGTACRNQLLTRLRAEGERGMALLKTRWKALHRIRLCPQRIGAIVAAALVLTSAERPIR